MSVCVKVRTRATGVKKKQNRYLASWRRTGRCPHEPEDKVEHGHKNAKDEGDADDDERRKHVPPQRPCSGMLRVEEEC